jgi:hypothetical protein
MNDREARAITLATFALPLLNLRRPPVRADEGACRAQSSGDA